MTPAAMSMECLRASLLRGAILPYVPSGVNMLYPVGMSAHAWGGISKVVATWISYPTASGVACIRGGGGVSIMGLTLKYLASTGATGVGRCPPSWQPHPHKVMVLSFHPNCTSWCMHHGNPSIILCFPIPATLRVIVSVCSWIVSWRVTCCVTL
jgi:hypothetical protein